MAKHAVTLLPGDGVGPEICDAAVRVLEATGVEFEWDRQPAGEAAIAEFGTPLPDQVLDSIRKHGVALKGPITTPVGSGFRSVNVALRQALDLYALVRPVKAYKGARNLRDDLDFVIVRENTEDIYAGLEFEKGTPDADHLIAEISDLLKKRIRPDSGLSIKPISVSGSERIVQFAFDYARENKRRKVTAVHKANIMKHTDGLFLAVARQVAARNTDIEFEDRIVDNMCMQLVLRPKEYDVLCCPNLYGDIISDLGAGMIGGLGLAPGANIGTNGAVFEATHGSAPKYAGQNKVNPMAVMLSGVMMLRYLEEVAAADGLEKAIANVIALGENVTYDLKEKRDDPTAVGTSQVADAVIAQLKAGG
ncbi:MAG TPA: isocitrate/isopropylmalate dehydrogenase family protein [Candidatus Dormibacteraeota bacterium]|nr:isocitrate/isopropylmalate dehydrogenase family protein [Candidatus Dormibacteraeota bacterium]